MCSPPTHRFALPSRHQAVLDNLSLAQKQPAQPRVHPKPYRRDTRERKTAARMQPRMERRNEVTAPPASPPPDAATPHPHSPPVPRPLALHPCPPPGHFGLLSPPSPYRAAPRGSPGPPYGLRQQQGRGSLHPPPSSAPPAPGPPGSRLPLAACLHPLPALGARSCPFYLHKEEETSRLPEIAADAGEIGCGPPTAHGPQHPPSGALSIPWGLSASPGRGLSASHGGFQHPTGALRIPSGGLSASHRGSSAPPRPAPAPFSPSRGGGRRCGAGSRRGTRLPGNAQNKARGAANFAHDVKDFI